MINSLQSVDDLCNEAVRDGEATVPESLVFIFFEPSSHDQSISTPSTVSFQKLALKTGSYSTLGAAYIIELNGETVDQLQARIKGVLMDGQKCGLVFSQDGQRKFRMVEGNPVVYATKIDVVWPH